MVEEIEILDKNEAWDLVDFLTRRKCISRKCVFNKNLDVEGNVEKYKALLVAKVFPKSRELT